MEDPVFAICAIALLFFVADSFKPSRSLYLTCSSVRLHIPAGHFMLNLRSKQTASSIPTHPLRPFTGRPRLSGRWHHLGHMLMVGTHFAEECVVSLRTFLCLHVSPLKCRMASTTPVAHITLIPPVSSPSCLNLPLPVSIDSQQPQRQS